MKTKTPHLDKPKVCTEEDCQTKVHARGLCMTHYMYLRRRFGTLPKLQKKPCLLCPITSVAKGLCGAHYQNYWKESKNNV